MDSELELERYRLQGIILGAVSYGVLFLLTWQAIQALLRQRGRLPTINKILIVYSAVTFSLATVGFAANAEYTQMIYVDLRELPGGPPALITYALDYWQDRLAIAAYVVMGWLMHLLLVYRCFTIWDRKSRWFVALPLLAIFLVAFALSIVVLAVPNGTVWYTINLQLVHKCLTLVFIILYTALVIWRILIHKRADQSSSFGYKKLVTLILESAAIYTIMSILYIFLYAFQSDAINLLIFSKSQVQGIAQLLIIVRVARGQDIFEEYEPRDELPHDWEPEVEKNSTASV